MKPQKIVAVMLLFMWALSACDSYENLNYEPEVYLPLAKGNVNLNDITNPENLSFNLNFSVPGVALGAPVPAIPNPPLIPGPVNTPPEDLNIRANEGVLSLTLDRISIFGTVTNSLPAQINAGWALVFRNDLGKEIFRLTVENPIAANSIYEYSFVRENITLNPRFTLAIENITTPGSNGSPLTTNRPLAATLNLEYANIRSITLAPGVTGFYEATNEFSLGLEKDEAATGNLLFYFKNSFAIGAIMQVAFLDSEENVLSTLFTTPLMLEAGTVEAPFNIEQVVPLNDNLSETLKNAAFIRVRTGYTTQGQSQPVQVLGDPAGINYQLVGDLTLNIKEL